VKRSLLLALASSLVLAAALVPAVLAADDPAPAEPTRALVPSPTPADGNGEIVIDPTFITETPAPRATPRGEVRAATGRPQRTPPATDTNSAETAPGTGLQVLLLVAIAGCSFALLAARVPAARRS
jgi:hypothetical protein